MVQYDKTRLEYPIEMLLTRLGINLDDPNFKETPTRVVTYLVEHFTTNAMVRKQMQDLSGAVFPSDNCDMVVVSGARIYGLCPHHLLPVLYDVSLAYIPAGKVIGLSKLVRVADIVLKRPVLQESGTVEVAAALVTLLDTDDVAVVAKGQHLCMTIRGVKSQGSVTTTSTVCGVFKNDPSVRAEFFSIVQASRERIL